MKILLISYSFPSKRNPHHGIFVKNLMNEMVKQGQEVTVIAPLSILSRNREPLFYQEDGISIYRPKFLSLGAARFCGGNVYFVTQFFFNMAVMKIVKQEKVVADIVYSHFLLPSGAAALKAGFFIEAPVFCTLGESSLDVHEDKLSPKKLKHLYAKFDGFIFNSVHTKEFAIEHYGVSEKKCLVVPNGVDKSVFYPRDKVDARKKLGLPINERIVIFVGSFIERKGPLRVLEACNQLRNSPKIIFVGSGQQKPDGKNVLFKDTVEHSELPWYLSAADVFALPTLSEGMPNAVLEALACGLPVVTSPIPPNTILLGSDYSLFCDPLETMSIGSKIAMALELKDFVSPPVHSVADRASIIIGRLKDGMY
jgi:teichuronic acid biosynthesis glycosyltransferase TuaC